MIDVFALMQSSQQVDLPGVMDTFGEEILASAIRLPLAAGLGTVLALRPRRGGTPERQPAVVQTQIILAVVGSLIMLVEIDGDVMRYQTISRHGKRVDSGEIRRGPNS